MMSKSFGRQMGHLGLALHKAKAELRRRTYAAEMEMTFAISGLTAAGDVAVSAATRSLLAVQAEQRRREAQCEVEACRVALLKTKALCDAARWSRSAQLHGLLDHERLAALTHHELGRLLRPSWPRLLDATGELGWDATWWYPLERIEELKAAVRLELARRRRLAREIKYRGVTR